MEFGCERLASCSQDGTVRIWDPVSGASMRTICGRNRMCAVAWAGDGTRLAASGRDGLLKCWDVATGRELWSLPPNSEGVTLTVAWSPDGTQLATGGMDNSVGFRDAVTGTNLVSFFDNHNQVLSVAWNSGWNAGWLRPRIGDGRIAIRDMLAGGRVIRDFRGHLGSVRCVCWQPNGSKIASASVDGTVKAMGCRQRRSLHHPTLAARSSHRPGVEPGRHEAGRRQPAHGALDLGFEPSRPAKRPAGRLHAMDLGGGLESGRNSPGLRRRGWY